jgi:hypothetical protein
MNPEPVKTRDHPGRQERPSQEVTYTAEKLRGAVIMYGPSVALDLFQDACPSRRTFHALPDVAVARFNYAFGLPCSRHLGASGVDSKLEESAEAYYRSNGTSRSPDSSSL